jgi:hypothetical protein
MEPKLRNTHHVIEMPCMTYHQNMPTKSIDKARLRLGDVDKFVDVEGIHVDET